MKRIRIDSERHTFFPLVWQIYIESFPFEERRDKTAQFLAFQNSNYNFDVWTEDLQVIAFIAHWTFTEFCFVEHFVVNSLFRNKGLGSKLLQEWIGEQKNIILLEIEPVTNEQTQRRFNFYHKLKFVTNNINHFQPPYHNGYDYLPLQLLSYPKEVSVNLYKNFYEKLTKIIIPM